MPDKISRAARRKQQALEIEQSQAGLGKSIAETERLVVLSDEMLARHQWEREADEDGDYKAKASSAFASMAGICRLLSPAIRVESGH